MFIPFPESVYEPLLVFGGQVSQWPFLRVHLLIRISRSGRDVLFIVLDLSRHRSDECMEPRRRSSPGSGTCGIGLEYCGSIGPMLGSCFTIRGLNIIYEGYGGQNYPGNPSCCAGCI